MRRVGPCLIHLHRPTPHAPQPPPPPPFSLAAFTYQAQDPDDITQFTDDEGSPSRARREALEAADPVRHGDYLPLVRQRLGEMQQALGPEAFAAAMGRVDASVQQQMGSLFAGGR